MRVPRTIAPASVAVLLLLSACGGGDGGGDGVASLSGSDLGDEETTDTTLSEEEAEEALLDWAACMRGEGIDMPDPEIGENGGVTMRVGGPAASGDEGDGAAGPGPAMDMEAMEAAMEACGEPPRVGGEFSEEDRAEMQEQALAFAECMRDEGVADFPDPDFSGDGPGAGPSVRERTVNAGEGSGEMIAGPFGEVDLSDPETEAAFEACQDELGGMLPDRAGRDVESAEDAG